MRWASTRSRHDGSSTDTQADTKTEVLVRVPPTIVSRHEEDAVLKEVELSRYRCANCILETKTKVGSTTSKVPVPRTNPNINESSTTPKSHTHPPHECDGRVCDPEATFAPPTPKSTRKPKPSPGRLRPLSHVQRRPFTEGSDIATVSLYEMYSTQITHVRDVFHPNHTPIHHTNVLTVPMLFIMNR